MELLLAIALSSIIAILAAKIFGKIIDSYIYSRQLLEMGSQTQLAMERIIYEIGESKTNEVIISPSHDEVTFIAHEDSVNKHIHYYVSGNNLYRDDLTDGISPEILIDNVVKFSINKGKDINGVKRFFYPIILECKNGKLEWKIKSAAKCQ